MNIENNILIERYLKNELTKLEQDVFLKKMHDDKTFREQVLIEKQLLESFNKDKWSFAQNIDDDNLNEYIDLFNSDKTQNLKQLLEQAKTNHQTKNKPSKHNKWYLYVAAILLLIVSITPILFESSSSNNLYNTYLNTSELPSLVDRENKNKTISKAQYHFENKEYNKALQLFNSELNLSKTQKATINLYKGIAYMELGNYKNAELHFNKLITSNLMDAQKGYWYKALLFIKMNNIKDAKALLNDIISNKKYNHIKAQELLKEL